MSENSADKINSETADAVARNLGFLIWSGAASVANSVLLWIFFARWRNASELGGFTLVMGLYALFFNVCSLGLSPFLVNEISRRNSTDYGKNPNADSANQFIGSAAIFLLVSGAICAVLMTVGGIFLSDKSEIRLAVAVLSLALIPTGVIVLAEAAAISFGRGRLIAGVTTLENVLRTVVPLILLWFEFSVAAICLSFAAVRIVALAVYLAAARKHQWSLTVDADDIYKLLKVAPTFAGTVVFAALNWQLPILLLARVSQENEAARYGVASRFLIPAAIFAASCANAIQPKLVAEYEKSPGAAFSYLRRTAGVILFLTVSSAVIAPFLSVAVLTVLFGEKYADAARTLDILAVAVVPFALTIIIARGLILIDAQRVDLFANIIGAAIGLIAGLSAIPRYGAAGAAAAQTVSFALMATIIAGYLALKLRKNGRERIGVSI